MWADRDSTKPLPPRGTAHTLWAGTAGVKAVSYSKSLAHRQALPLLLSCLHTLLTPRGLDQGPGGLPAAWTLVRPQPPGLRSGYPSKAFPHLPHQVKCYLSLEARLKSFLCLLSSSVSLPVSPGILYFPACGLFVWSFCSSQHRAGALSLLCCSSCSRATVAPSTLPGTAWLKHKVWDLLQGRETTSFSKTQHSSCFTWGQ